MFRYFLICVIMQAAGAVMLALFQFGIAIPVIAGFAVAFALFGMILVQESSSVRNAGVESYDGISTRLNEAHQRERGPDIPELDAVWRVVKATIARPAPAAAPVPAPAPTQAMTPAPVQAAA